jgi:hypothetical protein
MAARNNDRGRGMIAMEHIVTGTVVANRRDRANVLAIAILVGALVYAPGCAPKTPPRISLIRKGMTVQQVEQSLGKSIWVEDPPNPVIPDEQLRQYRGDGDHTIFVNFKKGRVLFFRDRAPRKNWPPVG